MSLENMSSDEVAHVALFPSAGMGHLVPKLRLAALLVNRHCRVTLITPQPTVSFAESKLLSRFHSAFPQDKKVDKEDDDDLEEVVGVELMKRLKSKGLVVKEWVDQSETLSHGSVGGFVSHCEWDSVVEAAWYDVPILGWPQIGDQKINAEVVEKSGWGMWKKTWGWSGENLVKGEEIGAAIDEMMKNEALKVKAGETKEAARKAGGGSTEIAVGRMIDEWKKMNN